MKPPKGGFFFCYNIRKGVNMAKGKTTGEGKKVTFSVKSMINAAKNEYIYPRGDIRARTDFIDTGSYALNAILSGSIKKGLPDNRSVMFAGEPATGKTFFTLRICKKAADAGYFIFYVDTEGEKDEEMFANFGFKGRGIDYEILKIKTVEALRVQIYNMLEQYKAYFNSLDPNSEEYLNRPKFLFVIDSVSMLTTEADQKNLEKRDPKDNLRLNKQLKAFFRDVTLDMNVLKIPLILINHVYDMMEQTANSASVDAGKKVGGGTGGLYGASAIIVLKTKESKTTTRVFSEKDGENVTRDVVTGTFFTCKAVKSRYIRKGSQVDLYVDFQTGVAKNFGLQQFCEGTLVEPVLRGSKGKFYKLICKPKDENGEYPEVKSYVAEIPNLIEEIDVIVKKTFQFGNEVDENGEMIGIVDDAELIEADTGDEEFEF
jgi:RecA/RadA recombinase